MTIDIKTVTPAELEEKLYQLAHQCYEAKTDFIKSKEDYNTARLELKKLQDNKEPCLALLCSSEEFKHLPSMAQKERSALISLEWAEYLNRLHEARVKEATMEIVMDTADAKRENLDRLWNTARSLLTSRNSERKYM